MNVKKISKCYVIAVIFIASVIQYTCNNGYEYPFQNPGLSFEYRVDDLVNRLTLEEKVSQMMNHSPAIDRLGIPAYDWWNECLHGVGRSGLNVTVFPQAIGLAATFDSDALRKTASYISDEARAVYHESLRLDLAGERYRGLTFWTPNINIVRDPRWGRGQETYGEDPYLTSVMGAAMVHGLQGDDPKYLKTSACAKHYAVHSGPELLRHEFDVTVSNYDLWDTYLPAFKHLVVDAKVSAVMCAYNRYAGQPCCGNDFLMNDFLRNQWGFTGYATSDCGAVDDFYTRHKTHLDAASASADAVLHGTDLECGGSYQALLDAVKNNFISEKDIDVSVKRLFMIRFRLGMFDPDNLVKYSQLEPVIIESDSNKIQSLEMAQKSIVLLKNENNLLPLDEDIKTIAVVGPNADNRGAQLGNYNGFPTHIVSVLEGIKATAGSNADVIYEKGLNYDNDNLFKTIDLSQNFFFEDEKGWLAEYYANRNLEGEPLVSVLQTSIDLNSPQESQIIKGIENTNISIRYKTIFKPSKTDNYAIQIESEHGYKLYIDDRECLNEWWDHGNLTRQYNFKGVAGSSYEIKIEYFQIGGRSAFKFKTGVIEKSNPENLVNKVKDADVIVFVGGISNALEGEDADKSCIDIPAIQTEYMKALKNTGKPVVLVLFTGSAMNFNWETENIPAILNAWYAGQDGGTAIAKVLFGDYNPAGRLPVTFYKSLNDLPPFEDYKMAERTYRYFKKEPLYPFGFGLSYTRFDYNWQSKPAENYKVNEIISFSVDITNSGDMDGDEVAQAYLVYPEGKNLPLKELRYFKRVTIEKGNKKTLEITIPVNDLKKWDEAKQSPDVPKGEYRIFLGGSSSDEKITTGFNIAD
ncbi:MAG: glycoside hydrolase family 3 C-terminal domain-containing protein [Bacteroidales bacterium]|nr:glycoside hydrolase family 3 C-terminal domain-containing protein [Bacteroidales bacterium]